MHSPRAVDVKYRVGQVVKHKLYKYRAVIIGWDERPRAPRDWFTGESPLFHRLEINYLRIEEKQVHNLYTVLLFQRHNFILQIVGFHIFCCQ